MGGITQKSLPCTREAFLCCGRSCPEAWDAASEARSGRRVSGQTLLWSGFGHEILHAHTGIQEDVQIDKVVTPDHLVARGAPGKQRDRPCCKVNRIVSTAFFDGA